MNKFKILLILSFIFFLFGCKKSDFSSEASIEDQIKEQKNNLVLMQMEDNQGASNRTYTGFVDLYELPNDEYSDGHIIFDQIVYGTGDYLDGEPVDQINFYFDQVATPNVLWYSSAGPYFVYIQGTYAGNYSNFSEAVQDFNDDYDAALSGQGPIPYLDDYLPDPSNGELVTSGLVVRRHSSSTTFAIAPTTFEPVISAGSYELNLGLFEDNGYSYSVNAMAASGSGVGDSGPLSTVEVSDAITGWPIDILGFVGTYTRRQAPLSGFDITGEITLTNNSIVSFSGVADGM